MPLSLGHKRVKCHFLQEKLKMPEFDPLEAKWDDRNYHKRWRLYLTDYLVWADSCNPECFAQMKKAAIEDSWKSDDNAAQEVAEVLSNWDWDSFQRWISNEKDFICR